VPKKKVQSLWSRITNGMKKNPDEIFADSLSIAEEEEDVSTTPIKGYRYMC
jgi:hypothetical protein